MRLLLALLFIALPASAAIIRVKPGADPAGTLTGNTWTNATNLQRAIAIAGNNDRLWLTSGTYNVSSQLQPTVPLFIAGGFDGTEAAEADRDLNLAPPSQLTGGGTGRILSLTQLPGTPQLSDLTFTQGTVSNANGGALSCLSSRLIVTRCIFSNNSVEGNRSGGAVFLQNAEAAFIDTTFTDNSGTQGGALGSLTSNTAFLRCNFTTNSTTEHTFSKGGALYFSTSTTRIDNCNFIGNTTLFDAAAIAIARDSDTEIIRCTFTGNVADRGSEGQSNVSNDGGCIDADQALSLSILDSTFSQNQAGSGGALNLSSTRETTIRRCTFEDNTARTSGAAIHGTVAGPIITDCSFTGNTATTGSGGAIYLDSATTPQILRCSFEANVSDEGGGALLISLGDPVVSACTFTENSTSRGGGAIRFGVSCKALLTSSTFTRNSASRDGGAVNITTKSPAVIRDCVFDANTAVLGGGAIASFASKPEISLSSFTGNSSEQRGGAVDSDQDSLILHTSTLTGNSAPDGGAISSFRADDTVISRCTISGNTASNRGGAIFTTESTAVTVVGCLVAGNTAGEEGGGFLFNLGRDTHRVTGCTVTGNSATTGGALAENNSPLTVANSILWANTGTPTVSRLSPGSRSPVTFAHSIVAGSGGSTSWDTSTGIDGGNNLDTDPLFRTPGTDLRLAPGSPAIDAGSNTLNLETLDLDAAPRTADGNADGTATTDIGAFESAP